ncbi:MAG: DUF4231 domain-containing protein [Lentisphaeraceae bacterium]|nr:DUF4231 domain-containing protein [Lentisphaeraceae bacterium]
MNIETYLEERLQDQIDWHGAKSSYNQKCFKRLRFYEICSAAMIPFLTGIADRGVIILWLIGFLGVVIAICSAASSLYKYQENWIEYRSTAEKLMQEKYFYLTNASHYKGENQLCHLVERVEGIISSQNTSWQQYIQQEEQGDASSEKPAVAPKVNAMGSPA